MRLVVGVGLVGAGLDVGTGLVVAGLVVAGLVVALGVGWDDAGELAVGDGAGRCDGGWAGADGEECPP